MMEPVKFETGKLLRDKGYNKISKFSYNSVGILSDISNRNSDNLFISAPYISEVIMWLYEEYDIWVSVQPNEPYNDYWYIVVYKGNKNILSLEGYDSPEHGYESVILYILNNLL
jgi:hypothetical protein